MICKLKKTIKVAKDQDSGTKKLSILKKELEQWNSDKLINPKTKKKNYCWKNQTYKELELQY